MRIAILILGFTLTLFLAGCGTTQMTDIWQAEGFSSNDLKNVLVVAGTSNTTNRVIFEASFVEVLRKKGINASASYAAIGDEMPTKEAVLAFVKESNVDHVVTVVVGAYDVQVDRVPESVATYVTGPYYPYMGGYWGGGNAVTMTRESYIDTQTNVILTTSVYNAKTQALAWGGRSKSFDVNAISQVSSELAHQMVSRMSAH